VGTMFAAVDVHYLAAAGARAALVTAEDVRFAELTGTTTILVGEAARYRPGQFYLRELPPIRAVCQYAGTLALVVVDGYVDLDPSGRPGLGAHVHAEFGVPVIGVAKSAFRTATHAARVRRGQSDRSLFITAAGMTTADAASLVADMAGPFRIPDALRRADRLARGLERPDRELEPSALACRCARPTTVASSLRASPGGGHGEARLPAVG
jgi:deoxyribonuclease V